jgi:hypothetical protein
MDRAATSLSKLHFPPQDQTDADSLIASLRQSATDARRAEGVSPSSPDFTAVGQRSIADALAVAGASSHLRQVLGLPARNSQ